MEFYNSVINIRDTKYTCSRHMEVVPPQSYIYKNYIDQNIKQLEN